MAEENDVHRLFELAQIQCEVGGWSKGPPPTAGEISAAEQRWTLRSYREEVRDEDGYIENQCGGCRFFAASGLDFGICWNQRSPRDGCVVFEHGGCSRHSELTEQQADRLPHGREVALS
jgi:hypothetical protein